MRLFITCDSWWEAKVDKVLDTLHDTGYIRYFLMQNYGSSLDCVGIVLMCRDPNLNFKQRIRFARKEKTIYLDIMLDLNQFLVISQKERERIIVEKLISEVPPIIAKYKLADFNLAKFETDLKFWMSKIL